MADSRVVDIADRELVGIGSQQFTCANPRCDEQFLRTTARGRPKEFHSDECRRAAERDLRRIEAQLAHHERQAEQLRAQAGAYTRTQGDTDGPAGGGQVTSSDRQTAAEAVAEVRGMARFLEGHQGEFAGDLLRLYRAVEPLVRRS